MYAAGILQQCFRPTTVEGTSYGSVMEARLINGNRLPRIMCSVLRIGLPAKSQREEEKNIKSIYFTY